MRICSENSRAKARNGEAAKMRSAQLGECAEQKASIILWSKNACLQGHFCASVKGRSRAKARNGEAVKIRSAYLLRPL